MNDIDLVGKFVLISYSGSNAFMAEKVHEVKQDFGDSILLASGTRYYKTAILAVFDNLKDANNVLSMHHTYQKFCAENRKEESDMANAVKGYLKHFGNALYVGY